MRPLIFTFAMIAVFAAGPAVGATDLKPNKRFTPPPVPAPATLRGPVPPSVSATGPISPPKLGLPAPGQGLTGLSAAGLSAPPQITPIRAVGDPAPICRAECAKTRVTCLSTDNQGCDPQWIQCVSSCSATILR